MKILLLFLSFTFAAMAQSQSNSSDLPRILFDQGKFAESYETLQKKPDKNAVDYYNLANILIKLNKPNIAYAYLIKTRALLKSHESTLSATVDQTILNTEELLSSQSQLMKDNTLWQGKIIPFFQSHSNVAIWLIFVFANIAFAFCIFQIKPSNKVFTKNLLQTPFFVGLISWIFLMSVFFIGLYSHSLDQAVVVSDSSAARSGPAETFTELFRVQSGSILILTGKSQNGWSQVRFSTSQIGWVLDKELVTL